VLVVDDEPLVGRAVKRVLADRSEVTCVTGGSEALEMLRDAASFDVILCDLMMPDMTGPEFRAAILRIRPDLEGRLIFITGGAFTPEMEQFLAESPCPHLLKPFDIPVLRGMIADRLAEG
jgi:CheY-like chemotaxis protein